MREWLEELGWLFMYNELNNINVTLVREFYSNFSWVNQKTVFLRGKQIPFIENFLHGFLGINVPPLAREVDAYEKALADKKMGTLDLTQVLATIAMPGMRWDSYNPKSDRVDNAILTPEARGWQRIIACIVHPIKHHTTFSMNMALLFYTLINGGEINLAWMIRDFMYHADVGASDQQLPFPLLITKLAAACDVVPSPEDEYLDIPEKDRDCPFGDWRCEKRKARKGFNRLRSERKWLKRVQGTRRSRRKAWRPIQMPMRTHPW
ncbi:hypothetical protein PIB30_067866 [Stylosanthes scabra]|uniref:Putative plant transposon protein domain-containing protein n=1 Tax=Stylosanthes scabra TaxID=79078 RepID=A0ABU6WL00_9FABA|nr:hypothetical protein [Stylosanthes scabra]